MKKIYLLFCFLQFGLFAQAQWFETGTSWKYTAGNPNGAETIQAEYQITEQTTYLGTPCAKMEALSAFSLLECSPLEPPFYFYESGDSIFYATEAEPVFRLAYVFDSSAGDSWEYSLYNPFTMLAEDYLATVISTTNELIDGNDLSRLSIGYEPPDGDVFIELPQGDGDVLEYVGSINSFFIPIGRISGCDAFSQLSLVCFDAPSFSYINPLYESCTVGLADEELEAKIDIYPNPTRSDLFIEMVGIQNATLAIFNMSGKEAYSDRSPKNSWKVDCREFQSGIYLAIIKTDSGSALKKFMVQ